MAAPSVIIGGGAGSGKDTVGAMIAERVHGQTLALADPMKRLFGRVYGVDQQTLWGPSAERNKVLEKYSGDNAYQAFNLALERLEIEFPSWYQYERIDHDDQVVLHALRRWARDLTKDHLENKKPFTARTGLQTLGTECGRAIDKNFWVKINREAKRCLLEGDTDYTQLVGLSYYKKAPPGLAITTDGRFPNEISEELAHGGIAILVEPPGGNVLDPATQAAGVKNHASETNLALVPRHWWTYVIVNDKSQGLEALARKVDALVEWLTYQHTFV